MKAKSTISITFLLDPPIVLLSQDEESILQIAIKNGIKINHTCGGNGTCGTCRVLVREGLASLPSRNEIEEDFSQDRGFHSYERLACQTHPASDVSVEIPGTKY